MRVRQHFVALSFFGILLVAFPVFWVLDILHAPSRYQTLVSWLAALFWLWVHLTFSNRFATVGPVADDRGLKFPLGR